MGPQQSPEQEGAPGSPPLPGPRPPMPSASLGALAGDEVLGVGLRVVEDDEDGGCQEVVRHTVVAPQGRVSFSQGRRSQLRAANGVVPNQSPCHKDVLAAVRTAGRVLLLHRNEGLDSKVDALAVASGWGGKQKQRPSARLEEAVCVCGGGRC